MTVGVPLCARHRFHWFGRYLFILGGFLGIILLAYLAVTQWEGPMAEDLALALGLGAFAWIIAVFVLLFTAIRPKEITDLSITLTGVSRKFAEAIWLPRPSEMPAGQPPSCSPK
jgi:hypothetical protein